MRPLPSFHMRPCKMHRHCRKPTRARARWAATAAGSHARPLPSAHACPRTPYMPPAHWPIRTGARRTRPPPVTDRLCSDLRKADVDSRGRFVLLGWKHWCGARACRAGREKEARFGPDTRRARIRMWSRGFMRRGSDPEVCSVGEDPADGLKDEQTSGGGGSGEELEGGAEIGSRVV